MREGQKSKGNFCDAGTAVQDFGTQKQCVFSKGNSDVRGADRRSQGNSRQRLQPMMPHFINVNDQDSFVGPALK